jgi:hypothetical protein
MDTAGKKIMELEFDALVRALPKRARSLSIGPRLKIPPAPTPFVAPTLHLMQAETLNPLDTEVIFVKASAAVGKSTIANHLSSLLGIPLLDLAKVPVSTGSLKALLLDISGAGNPIKSFHGGRLPIIVDAIDEGRLLSGEQGLESFLETTGEFLNEDRSITNRPKIIFFGRYDSTEIAELWLDLTGNNVTTCKVEVSFFGENAAWKLIEAYAAASAAPNSAYHHHPAPVQKLIQAYFAAIESALDIQPGHLWADEQGKAFAGYAPVLAAVGSLLAQLDNFQDVTNRLKETGTKEAWGVIDTVLHEIMDRERDKLCEQLKAQISSSLPLETYDREEQLTFLTQFAHNQPIQSTGRVKLSGADQTKYQSMVKTYISEHPFIRNKDFGNTILGSVVVAYAIAHNLLKPRTVDRAAALSNQPFLWRAFSQQAIIDQTIDGQFLGYIFNSLWNDPIQEKSNRHVAVYGSNGDSVTVSVLQNKRRVLAFGARTPISFYGQIRDCEVEFSGTVQLVGEGPSSGTAFYGRGNSTIISQAVDVRSASITVEGSLWLEGETVSTPPQFHIFVINEGSVGWGRHLADQYPWNEIEQTLPQPYDDEVPDDPLIELALGLARRLPGSTPLVLTQFYTPVPGDPLTRWAARKFSPQLSELTKILIKHGMASTEALGVGSEPKFRVRVNFAWWDLVTALQGSPAAEWKDFIAEARSRI